MKVDERNLDTGVEVYDQSEEAPHNIGETRYVFRYIFNKNYLLLNISKLLKISLNINSYKMYLNTYLFLVCCVALLLLRFANNYSLIDDIFCDERPLFPSLLFTA